MNNNIQYDESQLKVIRAQQGYHIVLAPPGCGKTQLLTERIRYAHQQLNIDYADMLCLTFTNRAARGMQERIGECINDEEQTGNIFVGNLHRYCAHFLYEENILPQETSIIDENDALSILARYIGDDEYAIVSNNKRRREYADIFHLETLIHQIRHQHPKNLRNHPECINKDDIQAMKTICRVQQQDFTAGTMTDIFDHPDTYRSLLNSDTTDYGETTSIRNMLRKMELANHYHQYKKENHLVDFEDLLVLTYDALSKPNSYRHYPWMKNGRWCPTVP